MKLAFLMPSLRLSGGHNVVVEHAVRLTRDHDIAVTLVLTHHTDEAPWPFPGLDTLTVTSVDEAAGVAFDLAIATWWDTVVHLPRVQSKHYAYFVQSLEDRFHEPDDPRSVLAGLTYRLGLPVVTEARWIADVMRAVDPSIPCHHVRNGVNKAVFAGPDRVEPRVGGPLRVLVEGNVDDHVKGVPEALDAVARMTEPATVTVIAAKRPAVDLGVELIGPLSQPELAALMARTDVILKLSRVEGMSGPPLEGFHMGATALLTPVTGHDEYLRHGWNGLLTGWDDPTGTARQLDLLARDHELLQRLRTNALTTAAAWPGWDEAAAEMAGAVRALAEASCPDLHAVAPLLREARFQVARDSRARHQLKLKIEADRAHIAKLETEWQAARGEADESGAAARALTERTAELDDEVERLRGRLDAVDKELSRLGSSRWLGLLDRLERPARRLRPGLGSVRDRLGRLQRETLD